jgi:hypothetical protein
MIVFVSYSSKNRKRIEDLVLQLGQLGHDVQFESKVVGGNVTWQQVLETIASSDLFIATLSAETLVSYTAHIENEYARDLNKYILFVALDEISTLNPLDPQVRAAAIDFSESNPNATQDLAAAMSSLAELEPRTAITVPAPNWDTSLGELRQRVKTTSNDAAEQAAILLNLREFLERHETYESAKSLLAAFAAHGNLRPEIKAQARRLTTQVKRVGSLIQKIQQRGIFYGAIILSLLVSLAVVLLSQAVLQFRAQRSSTLRLTSTALTLRAVTATFTLVPTRVVPTTTPIETSPAALISPLSEMITAEITPTTSADSSLASPVDIETLASSSTQTPESTSTASPLVTNTPRPLTGTTVAQALDPVTNVPELTSEIPAAITSVVKPTSTPTSLPATDTPVTIAATGVSTQSVTSLLTQTPTQPTQVAALPTSLPTQDVSFVPNDSMANLEPLLTRKLYVGIRVVDSVFGVRVNVLGAAAKSAGVQVGDYILAVDDKIVRTRFEFLKVMQAQNHSSNVILRIRRNGESIDISMTLSEGDFVSPYPN